MPNYQAEQLLSGYAGTFFDYNEMAIQFGYVVMFAAAFPIASLAALVNNWSEIRVDAQKLLSLTRRPHYVGCEDIGTWQRVFEILSILSVINNCLLLGFTSMWMSGKCSFLQDSGCDGNDCDYYKDDEIKAVDDGALFYITYNASQVTFPVNCEGLIHPLYRTKMYTCCPVHPTYLPEGSLTTVTANRGLFLTSYEIVWVVLITEHILLFIKFALAEMIPDEPSFITKTKAKHQFEKEKLLLVSDNL